MTRNLKILILDDDHLAADLLSDVLGFHFPHATFHVVYSGEDAVAVGTEHCPNVAILDLEMSGIGGEKAAVTLRGVFQDAPPLLIAASGNVSRLAGLRASGPFDHLLSKPLNIEDLTVLLTRYSNA